jgi:hypothetical protein
MRRGWRGRWALAAPWRALGELARRAGARAAACATLLTYRRQELVVVGLLAAGVLGGFAVETWHRRAPAMLDWLEAERPRLLAPRPPSPARTRDPGPGRPRAAGTPRRAPPPEARPAEPPPVDLNRATADDLVHLPGVGPALAARILAARAARGGRFDAVEDLAAVRGIGSRAAALAPLVEVRPPAADGEHPRDPLEPWEPDR